MTLLNLWEQAKPDIKNEIGLSTFETWFSSIQIKEKNEDTLLIETPDEFFKNWIAEHYLSTIKDSLQKTSSKDIQIELSVDSNMLASQKIADIPPHQSSFSQKPKEDFSLNSRFSFENFVVGPSNRFSFSAAMAVAESPAKAYNPLFIYGKVGLGKTHLMQAITHKIRTMHPDLKISYLSSERFTNELINAIRHRSTTEFRKKYRNIDVLLVDDIQFIAGKEATQEEFFHTFNALHNSRKQIIISSDRPPKEITNLEDRLSSRFAWGLITDVQPPDFETRVAILRKKIEREPVEVPDNVITFIAEQIKSNIRELEGALIRVVAYSLLEEKEISLDMAKLILRDMVKETVKVVNVETIQKNVAEFFSVSIAELKNKRRSKNIILPRQIAMYLSRHLTNLSLPEIGNAFGGKDHTTVLHAFKKISKELEGSKELKTTIDLLITGLEQ